MTTYDELFARVAAARGTFDHRAHVQLTWLAVAEAGMPAAIGVISDGLRATARYAGVPGKYNATVSRAWVELIAHHATEHPGDDFARFAARNPALLDKNLLRRFYRTRTLYSEAARFGWVEPDVEQFPWLTGAPRT